MSLFIPCYTTIISRLFFSSLKIIIHATFHANLYIRKTYKLYIEYLFFQKREIKIIECYFLITIHCFMKTENISLTMRMYQITINDTN